MQAIRRLPIVLSLLLAPCIAQTASYTPFGNPCYAGAPGVPGMPSLSAVNLPRLGQTFQLQQLSGGTQAGSYEGGVASAMIVGFSRTSWRGVPLPWTPAMLQAIGVGACGELSVSGDAIVPLPQLRPRAQQTLSFPIPNVPALLGTSVCFQAADFWLSRHLSFAIEFGEAGQAILGQ